MRLLLVPTPLDFGCEVQAHMTDVLPLATLQAAATTTHWIVENAKSARAALKRIGEVVPLAKPLQEQHISELPREVHKKGDHAGRFDAKPLLQVVLHAAKQAGASTVGLMSEAGMPAIADPGSSVVRAAHALGMQVQPLTGPSSLLLALAASGLNGQNFAFVGYLPIDPLDRTKRVQALEAIALKTGQTQLFIEVPHRNAQLWLALLKSLKPTTFVSIASGLTLASAQTRLQSVADWKRQTCPLSGLPSVIGLGV